MNGLPIDLDAFPKLAVLLEKQLAAAPADAILPVLRNMNMDSIDQMRAQ